MRAEMPGFILSIEPGSNVKAERQRPYSLTPIDHFKNCFFAGATLKSARMAFPRNTPPQGQENLL